MNAFQIITALSALVSTVIVSAAVSLRRAPKSLHFLYLALSICLYVIGYFYEVTAPSQEAALLAIRIQYVGVPFVAPQFFLFCRDYCHRPIRNHWVLTTIMILPVLEILLVNLYPYNKWYYQDIHFSTGGLASRLVATPGPVYIIGIIYLFFFMLAGIAEMLRFYRDSPDRSDLNTVMVLIGTSLPPLALALYLLGLSPLGLDYSPIVLTFSLLVLGSYILRFRLRDWVSFARDKVLEESVDAYILISSDFRFYDANAAAYRYFPGLRKLREGAPLAKARDIPPELLHTASEEDEIQIQRNGETLVFRVSRSPFRQAGRTLCTSILLYDITETHRLMTNLNEMATLDALTGLYNRGTFFSMANHLFELALRNGDTASAMMLDIDFFKTVNDRHGHLCGDEVLRSIAKTIETRLRKSDVCGRFGGEEFALLLPGADLDSAAAIAEDLRDAVQAIPFCCRGEHFRVTVSCGVAMMDPGRHGDFEALVADADAALYRAKEEGRNRVCLHQNSVSR